MIHKIWKSNHLILLLFICSLFLTVHIQPQMSFTSNTSMDLISDESLQRIMSSTDKYSDILVMFQTTVPDLSDYGEIIVKQFSIFPVVRLKFKDNDQFLSFTQQFRGKILHVEPVRIIENILPNSQEYVQKVDSIQSHVNSTGANKLHQLGYTGTGVKIGIIDTGVSNHQIEFGSRIKGQEVFITEEYGYSDNISITTDSWGHGTHVAGLAAGSTTGLAPEAEIYSAKIIHSRSVQGAGGGGGEETTLGMLEAIEYLVENEVDVINISLGQYHNLVYGLREEIIDYTTLHNNIVFCVSAGNSGTSFGDRGSINNPAPSLQCIAAAASDILGNSLATFSSKGPKPDYSLKPDLSAPGLSIYGPNNSISGYVRKSGTSMASPIVAGAAAILIDFLRQENLSYTPGTIKSALLAGASEMGYDVWRQGAGFLNVSASLDILNSTSKINNSPDLVVLHPKKLPINPYEVLFTDTAVEFNLTVISSIDKNITITVPENLSDVIDVRKNNYILNNSMLIPLSFSIPLSKNPQLINGSIMIGDVLLRIEFEIREPVARILFEESYNRIVKHGFTTTVYEIQGDTSNTIGMFSNFAQFLAYENNYSITPHIDGSLSYEYLTKYDAVILANPFSLASDRFMDWVSTPGLDYIQIPQDTIDALYTYVDNGGGLLVMNSINAFYNISAMNDFLSRFDLSLSNSSRLDIIQSPISNPQDWTVDITSFPFRGNYIFATGDKTTVIAQDKDNPTIASYTGSTGGKVILFSSDLIFDNIGFSAHAYGAVPEHNQIFAFNAIAWLTGGEFRRIATATTTVPELNPVLFLLVLSAVLILLIYLSRNTDKK
ncbi:MAG: S8 family serine peptidase [Candidatus Heimdallarchaeota archaeon]|nr:S8 family serine peptidase [Candidatus Heimdallarchaeota archaeon]